MSQQEELKYHAVDARPDGEPDWCVMPYPGTDGPALASFSNERDTRECADLANVAWHSRDAEVAELKEKLKEAKTEILKWVERCSCGKIPAVAFYVQGGEEQIWLCSECDSNPKIVPAFYKRYDYGLGLIVKNQ